MTASKAAQQSGPVDMSKWRDLSPQEKSSEACYGRFMFIAGMIIAVGCAVLIWATIKGKLPTFTHYKGPDGSFINGFLTYPLYFGAGCVGVVMVGIAAAHNAETKKYPMQCDADPQRELATIRGKNGIHDFYTHMAGTHYWRKADGTRNRNLAELVRKGALSQEQLQEIDAIVNQYAAQNREAEATQREAYNIMYNHSNGAIHEIDKFEITNINVTLQGGVKDMETFTAIKKRREKVVDEWNKCQKQWDTLRDTLNGKVENKRTVGADISNDKL